MKYNVQKLDGRFSYHKWFKYYVGFPTSMNYNHGPMCFTQAQLWCFQTWGWSAEIRQWEEIYKWAVNKAPMMKVNGGFVKQMPESLPPECNKNWSWTNGMDSLRIYLKSDAELAFFQLAWPVDQ